MKENKEKRFYFSPVTEMNVLMVEAGFAASEDKYSNDPFEDGENY